MGFFLKKSLEFLERDRVAGVPEAEGGVREQQG